MALQIIDCEQGSPEWRLARLGIPTASEFSTIMATGRSPGSPSKERRKYMLTLIGERLTGEVLESYSNAHMERGLVMEAEACDWYAFQHDTELERVGFIRNGDMGCSPDRLVGNNGMLEIKTHIPSILFEMHLANAFQADHLLQVHGQLLVSEREWCDVVAYWPKLKPFELRVYRDEKKMAEIKAGVDKFNDELLTLMEKLRG